MYLKLRLLNSSGCCFGCFRCFFNIAIRKAASTTGNSLAPGSIDAVQSITLPSWLGAMDPAGNDDYLAPQRGVA